MHLLLTVLFAIAGTPDAIEHYPPPTHLTLVNLEWETHGEGWDKVMALPKPAPVVILETPPGAEDNVYRGMGNGTSDVERWRSLVASQWPAEQVDNALCMIRSESGGNPNARNPRSTASGLAQVMASVWADHYGVSYDDLYIPEVNLVVAASIWEGSGWQPWSPRTRRNCGL